METMKKYDELVEKAQLVRNVGKKITDIISGNESSIDWYRSYMAEKVAENPDWDCSYYNEQIAELEKENVMVREVEKIFWDKYVF
jgi:electron transfer flavoprotein alpha/beta subunit